MSHHRAEAADDELDRLLEFLNVEGETTKEAACLGTLAAFYRKTDGVVDCIACARHPACERKFENNADRIERFYASCFGSKPPQGWAAIEPPSCRNCFVRNDCERETEKPRSASVISFPAPAIATHTPEVETPVASEAAPATDATEPAVGFTFDSTGFVDALKKHKRMDVAAILANLVTLSNTIRPMKAETRYPFDLQCDFLAASLELNTRGMIPLLRPVARGNFGGSKVATTPDDITYFNHQRLVDLDYLAKHHPHGRGVIFEKLLNDDGTLDYAKALKWVSTKGNAEKLAELLQLTPHEQAELFIIRDNQTRKSWERLQTNKRKDTTKINGTLRRGRKPGTADQYWQLYALCVLLDWEVKAVADASTRCPTLNMSARTVRRNYDWLKGFMVATTDHSAAS